MRTSLDIPDALFRRAKRVALERQTTLKDLVARGLEKELGLRSDPVTRQLVKPVVQLGDDSPLRHSALVDDGEDAIREAEELDAVYRRR